jgi:AAA family ATP:ADP antiporter
LVLADGLPLLILTCCAAVGSVLQLANVLSSEALFYTCIIPFIIFFGSFAFIMYPLRDTLHPTGAGQTQQRSSNSSSSSSSTKLRCWYSKVIFFDARLG